MKPLNREPVGLFVEGWGWATWRRASRKGGGAPTADADRHTHGHIHTDTRKGSSPMVPEWETDL